jgi:hypothetical protein
MNDYNEAEIATNMRLKEELKYYVGTRENKLMIKRFKKWRKQKRKEFIRYFKKWQPSDGSFLMEPIYMILNAMHEYYKNNDNVWSAPVDIIDGETVENDTREETLRLALERYKEWEKISGDFNEDWVAEDRALYLFFAVIKDHLNEWWD